MSDFEFYNLLVNSLLMIITAIAVFVAIRTSRKDRLAASKLELFRYRFEIYKAIINALKENRALDDSIIDKAGFLLSKKDFDEIEKLSFDYKVPIKTSSGRTEIIDHNDTIKKIGDVFSKYISLKDI